MRPGHVASLIFGTAFCACIVATALVAPVVAGPIEDAEALRSRGDFVGAFNSFLQLATDGDPIAQFYVGAMYVKGEGVAQDFNLAAKWYRRAADQGDDPAQLGLGRLYQAGKGVPQDPAEALKWYGMSAGQGNGDAAYNIGLMYANGDGVTQDFVAARWWFQRAADQGAVYAPSALVTLTEKGLGLSPDYKPPPKLERAPGSDRGSASATANETIGGRSAAATKDQPQPPIPWDLGPSGTAPPAAPAVATSATPAGSASDVAAPAPTPTTIPPTQSLAAVASAAWESNPTVIIWRALQRRLANGGEKLNAERERQLEIATDLDRRTAYSWLGTPARFITRVAVKLCDPLCLAALYVLFRFRRRSRKSAMQ